MIDIIGKLKDILLTVHYQEIHLLSVVLRNCTCLHF